MKINNLIKSLFEGPRASLMIYWNAYGGASALFSSAYLWVAIVLSFLLVSINWVKDSPWDWAAAGMQILPDILGFTLGGYALLIGFVDREFLMLIKGPDADGTTSPYMEMNAAFVNFILVQFLALFLSVLKDGFKIDDYWVADFLGTTMFLYALISVIPAAFAILSFANSYDQIPSDDD